MSARFEAPAEPRSEVRTDATPRGLPGRLPAGETLLWQGAPEWRGLARRMFHVRWLAVYFAVLVAAVIVSKATAGVPVADIVIAVAWFVLLSAAAVGLLTLFAWLIARTTVYSITNRRLLILYGVAFPMTINFPFSRIDSAGLRLHADGTGDIPLSLAKTERIAYFVIWPHARPWRFSRAEPMLRCVLDAAHVAQVLGAAMTDAAAAPEAGRPRIPVHLSGARVSAAA